MVLKLSIRTSASPWQQQSDWGLRVTQNEYFSLLAHTKQLLFVTFCDTTAGIGASFQSHAWIHEQINGQNKKVEIVIIFI